jgi:hypothetical protein
VFTSAPEGVNDPSTDAEPWELPNEVWVEKPWPLTWLAATALPLDTEDALPVMVPEYPVALNEPPPPIPLACAPERAARDSAAVMANFFIVYSSTPFGERMTLVSFPTDGGQTPPRAPVRPSYEALSIYFLSFVASRK